MFSISYFIIFFLFLTLCECCKLCSKFGIFLNYQNLFLSDHQISMVVFAYTKCILSILKSIFRHTCSPWLGDRRFWHITVHPSVIQKPTNKTHILNRRFFRFSLCHKLWRRTNDFCYGRCFWDGERNTKWYLILCQQKTELGSQLYWTFYGIY